MKKLSCLFLAVACIAVASCWHNDHNINISYKESGHYYSMKAYFNKHKTRDVEMYMDSRIGSASNISFRDTRIDGELALDDRSIFYIKKYPGVIEIKLDKNKNSDAAYQRIKTMCEGIKKVLVQ